MKTQKPFNIHFVCQGNTYRSRLAAAYMDTLVDDRFVVTSSGIGADEADVRTAQPFTRATAKLHKLNHGIAGTNTQTSDNLLADADVIVFLSKDVYDAARKSYTFDERKVLVWHIADIDPELKRRTLAQRSEQAFIDAAAGTFAGIRKHCDGLYEYLTHTAWVDVVDDKNHKTGLRLPMGWATDRGLWHRGVHVVVQTTDGKFVVGKRVKSIVFAPGMLEISLGGGLDCGEEPLQAAARETHEELGIKLPERHFRPLFVHRRISYHPHYHKYTKAHVYAYAVTLPVHSAELRPQPGEVEELRLLTHAQVKRLLRTHRLRNFGRLTWSYKFVNEAVARSQHPF